MKRFFDLFFSSLAIIIFSPVLLITMILLRITGEHDIFYFQKRMGKGEKPFFVYKFATMLKNSEQLPGGSVTQKNDPRVLPVGRILRKTKINELPQLFNIWLGSMSIVGPRPLTINQYYNYSKAQREKISRLTPGLTGIGSLIFRDEEEIMEKSGMDYNKIHDTIIQPYKGDLECWFFSNNNLRNYFKIIFLTAISIVKPTLNFREKFSGLPKPEGILEKLL